MKTGLEMMGFSRGGDVMPKEIKRILDLQKKVLE